MRRRLRILCILGCLGSPLLLANGLHATDNEHLSVVAASDSLRMALDNDDDDDNGVSDATQESDIALEDLLALTVSSDSELTIQASGGARLVDNGRALPSPAVFRAGAVPRVLYLQGARASTSAREARVSFRTANGASQELSRTVVGLSVLHGDNSRVDAAHDAVGVSHEITNAASLPRAATWQDSSTRDPDNIRIEVVDADSIALNATARLERVDDASGQVLGFLADIPLERPRVGVAFRSPFLRLVGDTIDREAPGVTSRVMQVALRDRVRVVYPSVGGASQDVRVGRPGDENGPLAARRGTLRVHILRVTRGGALSMGTNEASALAIGRNQVAIANEIWLQCSASFGAADQAFVQIVDPPPPALLAFADGDGLPAYGGGEIRFRIGTHRIGPVSTRPNAFPLETARDVALAVRRAGYRAEVYQNTATDFGAGPSADLVVRDNRGMPVAIEADGAFPYSTDTRQRVVRGELDLRDGLTEFDNMNATGGTLEERTMIRLIADADPATVDVFLINRFAEGTREGESFIEGDGASIVNTLILDRHGVFAERESWTQSHELGHILLNHPLHPDNVGRDRPWLLMDADASLGLVTGPKRLSWDECHRMTVESGVDAVPALMTRYRPRARP